MQFIKDWVADKHDIDIYLRIHPRLQEIINASVTELYRLDSQNFYVIRPESPSSTYTLIDQCDAVLTFGSRAGIEATFWGKPSILVGTAVYESFDVIQYLTKFSTPFAVGGFMLFNLEVFNSLGGFNPDDKFAEDYHLSSKIKPNKFYVEDKIVYTT